MRKRMMVILCGLAIVGFATLIVRLCIIQLVESDIYQSKAEKQQMRVTTISPKRGTIYDRNMNVLAQSATVWTVFISPVDIKDAAQKELIATGLSELLEVDKEKILEKCEKKNYYEVIKKRIEKPLADKVTQFATDNKISAINIEEDNKRYYPYGNFAANILGFVGEDNQGLNGIESYYDEELSGTPGRVVSAKNAWGSDMPYKYDQMIDPKDGNSVVLTIDETIQHYLEKALETAVVENNVKNRAAGVVMNVKTGEILAMANKTDFDPNDPFTVTDTYALERLKAVEGDEEAYKKQLQIEQTAQWKNKSITEPYEPGSVFKILTASSALDLGTSKLTDSFTCTGHYQIGGRTIGCWKLAGHGTQDFAGIVKHSCNPGFIMVGTRMGGENFYKYFEAWGLTEKTGIDLPGEEGGSSSLYHSEATLVKSPHTLAVSAFGQTFKVTPIQLITAVSAAINGGNLMSPYVVKNIVDADGNIVKSTEPTVKRQVISSEVSSTISSILERVVSDPDGSGKSAYIAGYHVGGKTGTSEKIDKKDENGNEPHIASFLGFAPANDPQIAVLVMLDEPFMQNVYGSVIAAPVVKEVLEEALPYLGVEPQYTAEELANMDISVPSVLKMEVEKAKAAITEKSLKVEVVGSGATVIKQVPLAGQPIPRDGKVILYTEEGNVSNQVKMPNVKGMTALQVNQTLTNLGLNVKLSGIDLNGSTTISSKQSIPEGTMVEVGTVVEVSFVNNDPVE
ncbi:penicillin-binding transpeptidase domain-containing protein [Zongyangia hominis]|uniref:PASTA domain-containing protein n=1 Tax=Zongyangia hominis TaxID=2763677 RepID=A0A926EDG7_9FIRM|nr:penicillin-binding transpeptidase domain-containing protein [Zongyangia hominis]MBC8570111.1 PASTA domain-containing protein [Zongyangia hominis]